MFLEKIRPNERLCGGGFQTNSKRDYFGQVHMHLVSTHLVKINYRLSLKVFKLHTNIKTQFTIDKETKKR